MAGGPEEEGKEAKRRLSFDLDLEAERSEGGEDGAAAGPSAGATVEVEPLLERLSASSGSSGGTGRAVLWRQPSKWTLASEGEADSWAAYQHEAKRCARTLAQSLKPSAPPEAHIGSPAAACCARCVRTPASAPAPGLCPSPWPT